MSDLDIIWTKTFSLAFPPAAVWDAYLAMEETGASPEVGASFTLNDAAGSVIDITDVEPGARLAWTETKADAKAEMTVVFEADGGGTRLTVTRYGFGEGLDFDVLRESHCLGWTEGIADLALLLRTGVSMRRHLQDRSATGVVWVETPHGIEVGRVGDDSLGADAGLRPGDVLLSIDGAAVYGRSDLWFLARLYVPGREVEVAYVRDGEVRTSTGRLRPTTAAVTGELGLGPRVDSAS
jgi:hypothetical protein